VHSVGAIGDDALGTLMSFLLTRHGVDVSLLARKHASTTSATILPIRPNGERPALHSPGADRLFEPEDLTPAHWEAIESADVLHIGGPEALKSFEPAALVDVVSRAKAHGVLVTLDVLRPGDEATLERLAPVLALVDWFLPNEDQLRALTGEDDIERAAARIRRLGTGSVAVTCGAGGSLVVADGVSEHVRALPVAVADTTGCGDGYDAGFIAGLLLGCVPVECAWLATACGALVATGLGSDAGIVSLHSALDFLEAHEPEPAGQIRARHSAGRRHDRGGTARRRDRPDAAASPAEDPRTQEGAW
jgi:sugar/nucleoside kinase (ribokinase family)